MVLVHVTDGAESTNNADEQQSGQDRAFNGGIALQSGFAAAIVIVGVVVLGASEEPLEALRRRSVGSGGGLLKSLLFLCLLERGARSEKVEAPVRSEAEEEGGRRRRSEGREALRRRRRRPKSQEGAHFKSGVWRRIGV